MVGVKATDFLAHDNLLNKEPEQKKVSGLQK
jgi:hypothetical protein